MKRFAVLLALVAPPAYADDVDWGFVLSNVAHIVYHEAGHALIDQFLLPVIGQEEDAVDAFATLEVIEGHEAATEIVFDVAEAYLLMFDELGDLEPFDYFGAHDLDIQRAYRMVCHAFGSDEDAFREAAEWIEMPPDRREDCQYEAELAAESWDVLLEDTYRDEGGPRTPVTLTYDADPAFAAIRKGLQSDTVLEDIRAYLEESFAWPKPVRMVVEGCGEANAFYDPETVEIIFCYEFAEELIILDGYRR